MTTRKGRKPRHTHTCFVCEDCALFLGWSYPDGHIADVHDGVCDVCGMEGSLSWEGDWQKPVKERSF